MFWHLASLIQGRICGSLQILRKKSEKFKRQQAGNKAVNGLERIQ